MLCILPYLIYGARDESIHAHWRSFKDGSCVEVEAVDRARTHAAGVTAHESVRHKHGAGWTALSHMATLNGRTGLGLGNSPPLAVNSESRRPLARVGFRESVRGSSTNTEPFNPSQPRALAFGHAARKSSPSGMGSKRP